MNNQPRTSRDRLSGLFMIYYALMFIMILFGVVVLYINYTRSIVPTQGEEFSKMMQYLLYVLVPVGVVGGHFIYRYQLSLINPASTLGAKMNQLSGAILIRSSFLEAPGMLGAVAALVTGQNSHLLATGVMALVFLVWRPTVFTITSDLQLSQEEKSTLEDPDAIIK